jgi:hypothetical protein
LGDLDLVALRIATNFNQEFTFLPFTILLGLFFVFVFFYLPETKVIKLTQIHSIQLNRETMLMLMFALQGKTVGETTAEVQQRGWLQPILSIT